MSGKAEPTFDIVAEVLKKLKRNQKIPTDDLEKATQRYNQMVGDLNKYKTMYEKQQQGQSRMQTPDEQSNPSKAVEKQKDKNKDLQEDNEMLKRQIEELKHRLSVLTGQRLKDNNADIADLSDPYRPTNLAEKFKNVYDDDWTSAFEVLDKKMSLNEQKSIDFLANIIKEIDKFCSEASQSQRSKIQHYMMDDITSPKVQLPDGGGTMVARKRSELRKDQEEMASRLLTDFRKSLGTLSVQPLIEIFEEVFLKKLKQDWHISGSAGEIKHYVDKSIELIWMMKIQNPPMEFEWKHSNDICDKSKFTFYTKRGERVKQTVWPAVLLHKDGPLVSKGVVQAM